MSFNKIKDLIIGKNSKISSSVLFLLPERQQKNQKIVIGDNVVIRDGSILYGGITIGDGVMIDHYCIIREGTQIGKGTRLMNFTEVNLDVEIGENCRISGFLANRALVGNNTSSFGHIVHSYPVHGKGHFEPTPRIGNNVIIGRLAVLAGDIEIPSDARISAGEVVTERNIDKYVTKKN